MSQLTQYISGQTPPTEYFSAQRIIDGKVFAANFWDGVSFVNAPGNVSPSKTVVFGGLPNDVLMRCDITGKMVNNTSQNVAADSRGTLQEDKISGVFAGVIVGLAPATVYALNDPGVLLPSGNFSTNSANSPPASPLLGVNNEFILKAGRYAYVTLIENIFSDAPLGALFYVNATFTWDNMQ